MLQYDRRVIENCKTSIEPSPPKKNPDIKYLFMILGAFVVIFFLL